jgi:nitroimidazol reductase NimA-like FMN-containing flavoprotein (pyridoxamine 5'-phosphate oxidase superfamily)
MRHSRLHHSSSVAIAQLPTQRAAAYLNRYMQPLSPTERTRVRRKPERGSYDRALIEAILDEGLVCHAGFVVDEQPYVVPMTYGRVGDMLYLHGSPASRMLRRFADGVPVCVTVTLVDGLVLARSARMHSMNYRSVVVLGTAQAVRDEGERRAALEAILEHAIIGRWRDVRPPSERELRETAVLRLPLSEASAKVRSGPPLDPDADLAQPCWAGVLPLRLVAQEPVPDSRLTRSVAVPPSIAGYTRP